MNVPFVDLKSQYRSIKGEIDSAIQTILDSSEFVQGKTVFEFERQFSMAQDVRFTAACSSGTDALHLILWALGIGRGDEVIIPSHTFIATAEAVLLTGATPVFVDIDETSFTIDPSKIEAAITSRTKVVLPVHLYGQACAMDQIVEIARSKNLHLVEDACQAHIAEYKGKKVGSFGIASAFSFYPGKNLGAYGEAGAVVTNDEDLYKKICMLRDHGQVQKYYHDVWGHNYRMDGMQAAILRAKLSHLDEWTEMRRRNAHLYNAGLSDLPQIKIPAEMPYAKHVYHLYVIRTSRRDELKTDLAKKGVATGLHYPIPLHLQRAFLPLGYREGSLPVTEMIARQIISLPMYAELDESQVEYICTSVRESFD
jgi:dTDP-4-amino-4,6-dideoxygalactose transaminase